MDGTPGLQSGTFAGRYTIERELGRGATATVYLARDTQRGHAVAIKVLRPELAESLGADRFLKEIKVNERLHHPHISSVLDSGQHDSRLYFVLPHMEGGSLRQMLQREKQLPIETAVAITRTIALALDYAHKQGLIHRDVKPENILFTSGQACLADFGIARAIERAIDETTTSTGLVRGTPAYMSPEQASGSSNYDGRSDQYSLACVLYEMLAGVPAFIGPTPEAIIAMRFQHAPRDVRVYRSTVPPALEAVIDRALSLTPADRYATMEDFANAMDAALRAPIVESRTSGGSIGALPSRRWAFVGAAVIGVAVLVTLGASVRTIWTRDAAPPDTTTYLVLPVESEQLAEARRTSEALLQMMSRWKGISVVDPFTARTELGSDTIGISERRAASAARALHAGRYVRARVVRGSAGSLMYGALFDANDGSRLYEASVSLPAIPSAVDSAIATLTDELLLRSKVLSASPPTRVLPAMQLYAAALEAREAFSLRRADSLLLAALDADHDFARAALALAEVRAWREDPPPNWTPWVDRAVASGGLSQRERELANALYDMARPSGDRSCTVYRSLAQARRNDIGAWYGFATCLRRDDVVLPDRRSGSGWRFRSSAREAVAAYVRAFALAPALHRTFQAGGYDRLRRLFYTSPWVVRAGRSATDSTRYLAYASWEGDTLALVPYPVAVFSRGEIPIDTLAPQHGREVLRETARSWSVALPTNAAAKELVAISLEMFGDPAALDTLRAARALAVVADPEHRLRLAAEEAIIRATFARRDARQLLGTVALSDSVLTAISAPNPEEAAMLTPLAVLTGKCSLAGHLAARSADSRSAAYAGVSQALYAAAESVTVLSALGCGGAAAGVGRVSASIRDANRGRSETVIAQIEAALLGRALRLMPYPDSAFLARVATAGHARLLTARLAIARRDTAGVRSALRAQLAQVRGAFAEHTPEVAYEEAMLCSAIGDIDCARRILDAVLGRAGWFELLSDRPVDVAAILRAALLRADVARTTHDDGTARVWSNYVSALWRNADRELQTQVQREPAIKGTNSSQ